MEKEKKCEWIICYCCYEIKQLFIFNENNFYWICVCLFNKLYTVLVKNYLHIFKCNECFFTSHFFFFYFTNNNNYFDLLSYFHTEFAMEMPKKFNVCLDYLFHFLDKIFCFSWSRKFYESGWLIDSSDWIGGMTCIFWITLPKLCVYVFLWLKKTKSINMVYKFFFMLFFTLTFDK